MHNLAWCRWVGWAWSSAQISAVAILVKSVSARNFQRAVIMEPTPVEMQSFATVKSVFLWVQLRGDSLQALLNILGVEVVDYPRILVALSKNWDDAIAKWSALAKPATPAQKAKTVVARGAAVLTTTGRHVGEQATDTSSVSIVATGTELGKFKFNAVWVSHGIV